MGVISNYIRRYVLETDMVFVRQFRERIITTLLWRCSLCGKLDAWKALLSMWHGQMQGMPLQGRGNDFFLGGGANMLICLVIATGAQAYSSPSDKKLGGGQLPPLPPPAPAPLCLYVAWLDARHVCLCDMAR